MRAILIILITLMAACSVVYISGDKNKIERKSDNKLLDFNQGENHGSTTTKAKEKKGY